MASSADAARFRPQARAAARAPAPVRPRLAEGNARSLAALVAGEIIPRLVLAHGGSGTGAARAARADRLDADAFAPLTLRADTPALLHEIERLLAAGVSVDAVMVELLAPAARLLGRWWEEDRCSFIEVTMGLWRLQELVRELGSRFPPARGAGPGVAGRALFAPFPGEQHDFGAIMVSEMFNRHGWDSEVLIAAQMSDLLAVVADQHLDLVGLTLSCDCHSGALRSAVRSLRSVSRNAAVRVIVGGRVLNECPALADEAGADGTASDARGALMLAESLVGASARTARSI